MIIAGNCPCVDAPGQALDRYREKQMKLRTPTLKTLELFAQFAGIDALTAALRAQGEIPALLPRVSKSGRSLLPGDPGYEEAGEEEGRGQWRV